MMGARCGACAGMGWNARIIRNRANIRIGVENEPCRVCGGSGIALRRGEPAGSRASGQTDGKAAPAARGLTTPEQA